jgi:hypothetical protein
LLPIALSSVPITAWPVEAAKWLVLQKRQRINIHTDARCLELLAVLVRLSQSVLETLVQGATRNGFQQYVPAIAVVELG